MWDDLSKQNDTEAANIKHYIRKYYEVTMRSRYMDARSRYRDAVRGNREARSRYRDARSRYRDEWTLYGLAMTRYSDAMTMFRDGVAMCRSAHVRCTAATRLWASDGGFIMNNWGPVQPVFGGGSGIRLAAGASSCLEDDTRFYNVLRLTPGLELGLSAGVSFTYI